MTRNLLHLYSNHILTTKKTIFYVADSTTFLKERLCKLGGGIIVIKIKTRTTLLMKPVVVASETYAPATL